MKNCNQISSGIEVDDFNFPTKEIKNPHFEVLMRDVSDEVLNGVRRIAQTSDIATVINKYIDVYHWISATVFAKTVLLK